MFPKRGAIALVITVLAVVLLISFKTPDSLPVAGASSGPAVESSAPPVAAGGSDAPAGDGSSSATATPSPTASDGSTAQTVTGSLVQTRYGDVEVQITVSGGQVTDVQALVLPTHGRSGQISRYVGPILASEALQAQSASIDLISGATFTSDAYARSLQSALDQAGIAAIQNVG
jgi:uncharacterized protein with FMN-binding domain